MFFPVVIRDAQGNIKQEISRQELSVRHWKRFNDRDTPRDDFTESQPLNTEQSTDDNDL